MAERPHWLVRVAPSGPFAGARHTAATTVLVLVIVAVRLVDNRVHGVSLGVFYVMPVALAAIVCNAPVAITLAVGAAVTWSADGAVSAAVMATNSLFRAIILMFIAVTTLGLRDAIGRAQESEHRTQAFLAFIAHQLRTPAATAGATAQALLAQGADAEHEDAYLRIVQETQRIGRLVSSALRFVRLDQDPHEPRPVDLSELCRAETARQRSLSAQLSFAVTTAEPLIVSVSPEGFTEALSCVLDNARRHAQSTITINTYALGANATVTVKDDGPGMTQATARHAFEPFVAMDDHDGTGLGLAIARRLVEASGGSLTYTHDAFLFQFPLRTR